jgi:hypothetical protein
MPFDLVPIGPLTFLAGLQESCLDCRWLPKTSPRASNDISIVVLNTKSQLGLVSLRFRVWHYGDARCQDMIWGLKHYPFQMHGYHPKAAET